MCCVQIKHVRACMYMYSLSYVLSRVILQKANEQSSPCPSSPRSSPEKGEEPASTSASVTVSSTDDLMKGMKREKTDILKEKPYSVNTDNISVS